MSEHDTWYACSGYENDVVLATKVKLSRNLANFPFPSKLKGGDGERIQSLVFDAFNHFEDGEDFQAIAVNRLDELSGRILQERGVLEALDVKAPSFKDSGVVLRTDGRVSCTVNIIDHVNLAAFAPGMNFDEAIRLAKDIDNGLQKKLQFAASYDFGYLTSRVEDAGSGMKLFARLHLPSLAAEKKISRLATELTALELSLTASYGSASGGGAALGYYYDISSINSQTGTEFDQLAQIASAVKKITETERNARNNCKENMKSFVKNHICRALALARASIFMPLREAVDIVGGVKWGLDIGFLEGANDSDLYALLYRIQEAHLEYVLKNGSLTFEKDIETTVMKNERLRALILQEAFQKIQIIGGV